MLFITDPQADIAAYKGLPGTIALNIYQGYYENCSYAYILEFFTKASKVAGLTEQLELSNEKEIDVYKEYNLRAAHAVS